MKAATCMEVLMPVLRIDWIKSVRFCNRTSASTYPDCAGLCCTSFTVTDDEITSQKWAAELPVIVSSIRTAVAPVHSDSSRNRDEPRYNVPTKVFESVRRRWPFVIAMRRHCTEDRDKSCNRDVFLHTISTECAQ